MFPQTANLLQSSANMLRTSGDVSTSFLIDCSAGSYAPHERRCFFLQEEIQVPQSICSARAEMFLVFPILNAVLCNMLRTSGDVSQAGQATCIGS